MNEINMDEIIDLTKIHPARVRNIYLYGSRVYGSNKEDSDYDIMMVAPHIFSRDQFITSKYNINVHIPDVFEDELRGHDMIALECLWSPDFARLKIKEDYESKFILDIPKLKVKLLSQSHSVWHQAKMAIKDCDILRGQKRVAHALKILMFGIQIVENGKIVDFSEVAPIYKEVSDFNGLEWDDYRDRYLPLKKDLENNLKKC